MQRLKRLSVGLLPHRLVMAQTVLLLLCSFVIFTAQASAVIRFTNRSLFIYDINPGATTKYTISLTYTTQTSIGSMDIKFCYDPIPYMPCVVPTGLDVSNATLSNQTGETGYTIQSQTANEIVLTRAPGVVGQTPSSYTFDNIVNPIDTANSFAARLSDYASTDASGPVVDVGSVVNQTTEPIVLETQVPPTLVFCVAQRVSVDCKLRIGGNVKNLGTLDATNALTTTSQMAVGTNASNGFAITANGPSMEAGTNVIDPLDVPTVSAPGNSQFGINLVQNTSPALGSDPDGDSTNAVVATGYDNPNEFMYHDGDLVAMAPNVSLVRRYTVTYIVNVPPNLRPGVYTTTITYICTGRF